MSYLQNIDKMSGLALQKKKSNQSCAFEAIPKLAETERACSLVDTRAVYRQHYNDIIYIGERSEPPPLAPRLVRRPAGGTILRDLISVEKLFWATLSHFDETIFLV